MIDCDIMTEMTLMRNPSPDKHIFCRTAIVLRPDELVHAAPRAAVEIARDDDRQPYVRTITCALAEVVLLVGLHETLIRRTIRKGNYHHTIPYCYARMNFRMSQRGLQTTGTHQNLRDFSHSNLRGILVVRKEEMCVDANKLL